jgi:hypothetical protein
MKILWYQHIEHGIKCIISEKNKLPKLAIHAIKKLKNIKVDDEFKLIPNNFLKIIAKFMIVFD